MTFSLLALIVSNLVPLSGVVWLGWDVAEIVLLYWAENLVVGCYNILKMTLVRGASPADHLKKLLLIPFFCLHFGGFCAVHGVFLLGFFELGNGIGSLFPENPWPAHLVFLQLLSGVISTLWRQHPPGLGWLVAGLFLSHGISFIQNFLGKREYAVITVNDLMGQPYKRVVIMHLAVLAGGFLVMTLQSPMPLLLVLIALKIGLDVFMHLREHGKDKLVDAKR